MQNIHERIRMLRTSKDLSMEALARLVGVTWQTIQQWENGSTAPRRTRLQRVADTLGVTVERLLYGADIAHTVDLVAQEQRPRNQREQYISEINASITLLDNTGLAIVRDKAKDLLDEYALKKNALRSST
jgi:transcriptional regulator with XRE-family HTH domain